ncbi:6-phosphogluconolactonase [Sorangium cellulosum]|uniref:6-phosphogluconolactonase n=1 Tax=Sorangium cellulosum TaxID=56 RepID=UPI003D9AB481
MNGAEETCVAQDTAELARLGAELMARAITAAIEARGVARIALSGGSTPSGSYQRLAALSLPWERTEWFWVDERAVAPDHPRSNYGAARRDLAAARIPEDRFFRMEGESPDLTEAAARYEKLLRARFGVASAAAFDVMTLGIGDDAHTASLFPGTGSVGIEDRLVAAIAAQPDKGLEARLTLTAPVIREARTKLLLACGAGKREVLEQARRPGPADEVPARVVRGGAGQLVWLLDAAAAPAG